MLLTRAFTVRLQGVVPMGSVVDTKKIRIPGKSLMTAQQARKLLGDDAKDITNEELESLISATEQFARALLHNRNVHKQAVV